MGKNWQNKMAKNEWISLFLIILNWNWKVPLTDSVPSLVAESSLSDESSSISDSGSNASLNLIVSSPSSICSIVVGSEPVSSRIVSSSDFND